MKKENLKFNGSFIFEEERLDEIYCEIVFPKIQNEKVILQAHFNTSDKTPFIIPFTFALEAKILDLNDNLESLILSEKVYKISTVTSYSSPQQGTTVLTAEPVNLKIKRFFESSNEEEQIKNYFFWLTQSTQLAPRYIVEKHYNGNVSIESVFSKNFEIQDSLRFNFIDYHFYSKDSERKNVRISESILAAEFNGITEYEIGENLFPEIDLFLKMVSFSERRRIVCYGYMGFNNGEIIEFYRGDISIPEENFQHSINETLVDIAYFDDFIEKSYFIAKQCPFKKYLFDAISKAAYHGNLTVESEYLSYYAAIENLVNGYRDMCNLNYNLDNDSWKQFTKDLKAFIKKHDSFKDDKEKREVIYEKVQELNRVSFGTAFNSFCSFYQIDLSDLWPLGGSQVKHSLTKVRNRLIHGGRFEKEEFDALICAKTHLQWTLERCILGVLTWDVEKTKVRATFLKNFFPYTEWQEKMKLFGSR